MADLHGDSARRVVLDGVAVVGDGVGSEVVAGIKGQPLVLAPRGEVTAHLVAERSSVGVGRGEAFGPRGSAVRNRFKRVNAVGPAVAEAFEFRSAEVEAVERRARHQPDENAPLIGECVGQRQTTGGGAFGTTRRTTPCPSCGSLVEFQGAQHATECPFCATPVVIGTGTNRQIKPQAVLPFALTQPQARAELLSWLGSLWFAPNALLEFHAADTSGDGAALGTIKPTIGAPLKGIGKGMGIFHAKTF